jgi:tRNA A37 threonylcarbamoyladenosine biosynthesis protein TsaE
MEQHDEAKKGLFKLYSHPTDTVSPKYSFMMAYADGNQLIHFQIKWVKDEQMRITMPAAQHELIQQLCQGQV